MNSIKRAVAWIILAAMLASSVFAVSCGGEGNGSGTTSAVETDLPEEPEGTSGTDAPTTSVNTPDTSAPDIGDVTADPEDTPIEIPEVSRPEWMFDIGEKLAAQSNRYGRSMSAVLGGESSIYPAGSLKAMEHAIALGVDAIAVNVSKTEDGVLVAMTTSSLGDSTDILDKAGQNGLPGIWRPRNWTYDQIKQLRLKNADGSVSDEIIPTFEQVVKLCAGKCLIYIINIDSCIDTYDVQFYELAAKYKAYSSFVITPGADRLNEWLLEDSANVELAAFMDSIRGTHFDGGKPVAGRAPFNHTVPDWDIMWLGATDDPFGWKLAGASSLSFIITGNLTEYTEWISANFKSALEYNPKGEDGVTYYLDAADLTGRYLLVSDIHYVMAERRGQSNRVQYRGFTNDQRMRELCDDIRYEYSVRGLDAVYILGDLSTDDYYEGIEDNKWTGYTVNACKEVYEKFFVPLSEELGIPVYVMGGNHDSHSNEVWREFSGRDRQYVVDDGDNIFIVCDVYDPADGNDAKFDGNYANGNNYTGVDVEWLSEQLEKYKDRENVFILSHYFNGGDLVSIIDRYDNVVCLFDGHVHHQSQSRRLLGKGRIIINTGTYSYGDFKGDFGAPCKSCNNGCLWGFQILETTEDTVISYRIDTERRYYFSDGSTVYTPYTKYVEMLLKSADGEN